MWAGVCWQVCQHHRWQRWRPTTPHANKGFQVCWHCEAVDGRPPWHPNRCLLPALPSLAVPPIACTRTALKLWTPRCTWNLLCAQVCATSRAVVLSKRVRLAGSFLALASWNSARGLVLAPLHCWHVRNTCCKSPPFPVACNACARRAECMHRGLLLGLSNVACRCQARIGQHSHTPSFNLSVNKR